MIILTIIIVSPEAETLPPISKVISSPFFTVDGVATTFPATRDFTSSFSQEARAITPIMPMRINEIFKNNFIL